MKKSKIRKQKKKQDKSTTLTSYRGNLEGEALVFDDEGECISGSNWDYPGSPYLSEEDDIYGSHS